MLTLVDIVEALTSASPKLNAQVITEAVIDSRLAIPGAMFVAMAGEHTDGHGYVADAIGRGALIALVERTPEGEYQTLDLRNGQYSFQDESVEFPLLILVNNSLEALQKIAHFWRRKIEVDVVGITGSVGKSTTKEVIAEVLSQRYATLKNPGNLNNEIGLPLTVLGLTEGHQRAVLDMGFYVPGEIEFLCELALPKIGVVTNIGLVHAERAGSQEAIAAGKTELVRALPSDGAAVLNYDDPLVREMADQTEARIFYYGLTNESDLWADQVDGLGLDGVRFQVHYRDESLTLRVPMIGRHSVHTALRAIAVGLVDGLTWEEIVKGLRFGHAQLRLVAVRAENGALLLDDTYNASPQSAIAAINLLEEMEGRKIAVLGDMLELGKYERQGHEMVGIRSADVVDELITVGDRSGVIAQAAEQAGLPAEAITQLETSDDAIKVMRKRLSKDDVVLVKGSRGMHMDNIVPSLETQV
jgi:UDP-N-acetylmuramoyl-tripeptide--D-alanyl-D-alanine ligase